MDRVQHTYKWFNPRTGQYGATGTFTPSILNQWAIGNKPDNGDWVLLIQKG